MSDRITLWWLDIESCRESLTAHAEHRGLLTADEGRALGSGDRTLVRAALRCALWAFAGEDIARAEITAPGSGRPHLVDHHEVEFSISHSGTAALVAVASEGPLGVDIEGRRDLAMALERQHKIIDGAHRHGIAVEAGALSALDAGTDIESVAFLRVWTQLEAVAKARGDGIGAVLEAIGLHERTGPGQDTPPATLLPAHCTVTALTLPGDHVGALAHHHDAGIAALQHFPAALEDLRTLCSGP